MKKILITACMLLLVLSVVACSKSTSSSNTNSGSTSSTGSTNDSSAKTARISFDFSDKSTETYKAHVQDLWDKTKVLLNQDATKTYTDEQYIAYGKEMDEAWVNLQTHVSIASNGHDQSVQDTSDSKLGNMIAEMLGEIDKIYGQRSTGDTKEQRAEKRKEALGYLSATLQEFDDILAKLTIQ